MLQQPNICSSFHFSPACLTIGLAEVGANPQTRTGDDLSICYRAYKLKPHSSAFLPARTGDPSAVIVGGGLPRLNSVTAAIHLLPGRNLQRQPVLRRRQR